MLTCTLRLIPTLTTVIAVLSWTGCKIADKKDSDAALSGGSVPVEAYEPAIKLFGKLAAFYQGGPDLGSQERLSALSRQLRAIRVQLALMWRHDHDGAVHSQGVEDNDFRALVDQAWTLRRSYPDLGALCASINAHYAQLNLLIEAHEESLAPIVAESAALSALAAGGGFCAPRFLDSEQ